MHIVLKMQKYNSATNTEKPYLYFSSHSFQCLLFLLSTSSAVNCCSLENCSMRSSSLLILAFVPINANSWGLDWANISIIDSCLGTKRTNILDNKVELLVKNHLSAIKVDTKTFRTNWDFTREVKQQKFIISKTTFIINDPNFTVSSYFYSVFN